MELSVEDRRFIAELDGALSKVERAWPEPPSADHVLSAVCRVSGSTPEQLMHYRRHRGLRPEDYQRTATLVLLFEDTRLEPNEIMNFFPPSVDGADCEQGHLWSYCQAPGGSIRLETEPVVTAARAALGSQPVRRFNIVAEHLALTKVDI